MGFFNTLREKIGLSTKKPIIIVSGLPRSGTSMMMKMLEAGGLEPLVDNIRTADEDNPKGYYEFEQVKKIKEDQSWLKEAEGKVVKVISMLLLEMPDDYNYKVVFMRRNMGEILASQKKMLIRRGEPTDKVSDEKLTQLYESHLQQVQSWVDSHSNADVLYTHYSEVLQDPRQAASQINHFLGDSLNVEKMAGMVDEGLYRNRK